MTHQKRVVLIGSVFPKKTNQKWATSLTTTDQMFCKIQVPMPPMLRASGKIKQLYAKFSASARRLFSLAGVGSLWSLKHSSFTGSWHSRHQCRCGGRLILESSWQGLHTLVVPGKAVDTALHQNQAELGILVFAILVQVLPSRTLPSWSGSTNPQGELVPRRWSWGFSARGCQSQPLTCGTPKLSRRVTPIWEGVRPFLASLQMWSTTSSGFIFSQLGGVRL